MANMAKTIFSIALLLIMLLPGTSGAAARTGGSGAADPFDVFVSGIAALKESADGRIRASGTMEIKEGKYSGKSRFSIETASDGYRAFGDGTEILNDGKFNYIIDSGSKEVTVTDFDMESRSVLSNPLSVLFELPQGFSVKKRTWQGAGEGRRYAVELIPAGQETGLSYLTLYVLPDGTGLAGLELGIVQGGESRDDGRRQTSVIVDMDDFSMSVSGVFSASSFTPDLETLEMEGYFINDLRAGF